MIFVENIFAVLNPNYFQYVATIQRHCYHIYLGCVVLSRLVSCCQFSCLDNFYQKYPIKYIFLRTIMILHKCIDPIFDFMACFYLQTGVTNQVALLELLQHIQHFCGLKLVNANFSEAYLFSKLNGSKVDARLVALAYSGEHSIWRDS